MPLIGEPLVAAADGTGAINGAKEQTMKLSGITITECYADAFAFVEDKESNIGDLTSAEDLAQYDLPERLIDLLEPLSNAKDNDRVEVNVPYDLLREFVTTLENRIDIFDDNRNFNRTDGGGRGHSAGRGNDAEAAKFFASGLRRMRADLKTLEMAIESRAESSATSLVARG